MAFTPQGIVFYESEGHGWTETYYPLGVDYVAAAASMNTIITARAPLSTADVVIRTCRVSDLTVKGDSYLFIPNTGVGSYGAGPCYDPDIGVHVLLQSGFLKRSSMYLRGIPAVKLTDHPFTLAADTAWDTAFATWGAAVKANAQHMTKTGPGPIYTFTPAAYTDFLQNTISIRRAGRPFFQPRGHR